MILQSIESDIKDLKEDHPTILVIKLLPQEKEEGEIYILILKKQYLLSLGKFRCWILFTWLESSRA